MDEVAVSHLWDARHGLKRLRAHPESRGTPPVAAVSEPAEVAVTARHHARRHAARQYGPRARRRWRRAAPREGVRRRERVARGRPRRRGSGDQGEHRSTRRPRGARREGHVARASECAGGV